MAKKDEAKLRRRRFPFRLRLLTLLILAGMLPIALAILYQMIFNVGDGALLPVAIALGVAALAVMCYIDGLKVDNPRKHWRRVLQDPESLNSLDNAPKNSLDSAISPEKRVAQLEEDLARTRLLVQTLTEACLRKEVFTYEELRTTLYGIDKMDGVVDGKLAPSVVRPKRKPNSVPDVSV